MDVLKDGELFINSPKLTNIRILKYKKMLIITYKICINHICINLLVPGLQKQQY